MKKLILFLLFFGLASPPSTAQTLGETLRDSGFEKFIGTWIDPETEGEEARITYGWKFKDRVLLVEYKVGEIVGVGLIGLNAKTGEVYHHASDDQGNVTVGTWSKEDELAVLKATVVTGDGEEAPLLYRHQFKGENTMQVFMGAEAKVPFTLVRGKGGAKPMADPEDTGSHGS